MQIPVQGGCNGRDGGGGVELLAGEAFCDDGEEIEETMVRLCVDNGGGDSGGLDPFAGAVTTVLGLT